MDDTNTEERCATCGNLMSECTCPKDHTAEGETAPEAAPAE
ncbi:MAG: hypothetical protein AAB510_02135 [Patescibacteria group bacterium]